MWVTRRYNEYHEPDCKQYKSQSNPTTLHFFASVGWNFKTKLHLYWDESGAGNLNMNLYIECLEEVYLPELKKHKIHYPQFEFILEEDGNSVHGWCSEKNKVKTFKEEHGIRCYKNCPYSPDFSVIETKWRILKQRVRKWRCRTQDELLQNIYYEWDHITYDEINKIVLEMKARMEVYLDCDRLAIGY